MIYLELFISFLKVGMFSFGGAYGAIPIIREIVLSKGWLEDAEFSYMIAVSESTPGPIMVNLATYVGSSQAGFLGALLSTLAVILPAFLIILVIVIILKNIMKNKYVLSVLEGLKPCIVGIILATGVHMILKSFYIQPEKTIDFKALLILGILSILFFLIKYFRKKQMSPIIFILISAVLGGVVYSF